MGEGQRDWVAVRGLRLNSPAVDVGPQPGAAEKSAVYQTKAVGSEPQEGVGALGKLSGDTVSRPFNSWMQCPHPKYSQGHLDPQNTRCPGLAGGVSLETCLPCLPSAGSSAFLGLCLAFAQQSSRHVTRESRLDLPGFSVGWDPSEGFIPRLLSQLSRWEGP